MNCPNNTEAEPVYDGYAASGRHTHAGSGTNYLCLPKDPLWADDISGGNSGLIYGAEWEIPAGSLNNMASQDVPCGVCRIPRSNVLMIPGRNQCYKNWRLEYHGYLMSSYYDDPGQKEFVCMDGNPEALNSGVANLDEALFHFVEGYCGVLKCPPYIQGKKITCAVCSYAPLNASSIYN